MLQLGRVEEVGSGVRNVYKYLPHFDKAGKAIFKDEEYFTTTLHLSSGSKEEIVYKKWSEKWSEKWSILLTDRQKEILLLIADNPKITRKQLSEKLNINSSAIQRHIDTLKTQQLIERIGPAKGGHWQITRNLVE